MQIENDFVGTTEYTVDRLIKEKNWWDCLLLYFRYLKQRRLQGNVRTRSTDTFMIEAMWRWEWRFRKAKNKLKEMWLINIVQIRDEKGRVHSVYVKINFIIDEQKIRTQNITYELDIIHNPQKPSSGEWWTNTLVQNINTLKQKNIPPSKKDADYLLNSFWLSLARIEKDFSFTKSLSSIIKLCECVKYISAELDILPVYDKDTLTATSIMLSKWYSQDEIVKRCKDNGWDDLDNYKELIRNDYYLPDEIEK